MELTAVFEAWHIGDGNYPPLHVGQLVNLSFEIETTSLKPAGIDLPENLTHQGNAEYQFCGEILRVYGKEKERKLIVIQVQDFRFYIELGLNVPVPCEVGAKVMGQGTLLLDYYIWVEFLANYEDPPNLFYNLHVTRIRKIRIPERFVVRQDKGTSCPVRLSPKDYSDVDIEDMSTMEGQSFDQEFYLVDFDTKGFEKVEIPRTFL